MAGSNTRRDFLSHSGTLMGAGLLASALPRNAEAATSKGPHVSSSSKGIAISGSSAAAPAERGRSTRTHRQFRRAASD